MIRWILGIILVIVLILAIVFIFRSFSSDSDADTVAETEALAEAVNNSGDANQAPNVVGDSYATSAGQPLSGNALSNDTDPQNDLLVVEATPINAPTNGTVQLNADGNFVYTPNADYVGVDSFAYRACDSSGNCTVGIVQITINSAVADNAAQSTENATEDTNAQATDNSATTTSENSGGGTTTDNSATTTSENSGGGTTTDTSTTSTTTDTTTTTATTTGSGGAPPNYPGQPIVDPATHSVKQGEWLLQIARCYGTSPQTIVSQNYIPYPSWIMVDEQLTVSGIGSVSEPFFEPCIMYYTVQQGDTLYSISQTYEVDLDMLIKANFGCYGYGYYYYAPVPTPYEGTEDGWYMDPWYVYGPGYGAHSPYIYSGCYAPYYDPVIYVGQELVIPVNWENADMRPIPTPTK